MPIKCAWFFILPGLWLGQKHNLAIPWTFARVISDALAWHSGYYFAGMANILLISKNRKPKSNNNMNRILQYLPEIEGEEYALLERLTEQMDQKQMEQFATIYRSRRRDPQNVMIFSIVGLLLVPGLQRFYLGQIGWGILYLFTAGLCFIGSIVDLVNFKSMAYEYNERVAGEVARMV
jgi:TM2 domain-containing membrane protein YozV